MIDILACFPLPNMIYMRNVSSLLEERFEFQPLKLSLEKGAFHYYFLMTDTNILFTPFPCARVINS